MGILIWRNSNHRDRMKTPVLANDHADYLSRSSILSLRQTKHILPLALIIKALNREHIRCVLVGAHGHMSWRKEARATEDIDILVMARHQKEGVGCTGKGVSAPARRG